MIDFNNHKCCERCGRETKEFSTIQIDYSINSIYGSSRLILDICEKCVHGINSYIQNTDDVVVNDVVDHDFSGKGLWIEQR